MTAGLAALDRRALVLNRSWLPISVTTVRDALSLMVRDVARVVVPETYEVLDFDSWAALGAADHEPHIRTVSLKIPIPEVIQLLHYDGRPEREVVFSRRNLFRRDGHRCQFCGKRPGADAVTIDHVLPRSRGGKSSWENCVLACIDCNKKKRDRLPHEAGMKLKTKPIKPKWHPVLALPLGQKSESWERFVSRAYWDTPLKA